MKIKKMDHKDKHEWVSLDELKKQAGEEGDKGSDSGKPLQENRDDLPVLDGETIKEVDPETGKEYELFVPNVKQGVTRGIVEGFVDKGEGLEPSIPADEVRGPWVDLDPKDEDAGENKEELPDDDWGV